MTSSNGFLTWKHRPNPGHPPNMIARRHPKRPELFRLQHLPSNPTRNEDFIPRREYPQES